MSPKYATILIAFVLHVVFFATATPAAEATSTPTFPSCVNPQGTVKSHYATGTHGVPGQYEEKRGSDTVYQLSGNDQVMQCFCPENGNGVQTNWLKASNYTEEEIKVLKNEGWIYIADGSAWGLDPRPYVAKNRDYSCKSTVTPTPSQNNSSSNSSSNNVGSTNPLQSVLSLANTGNISFLYSLIVIGTVSFIAGFLLRWNRK